MSNRRMKSGDRKEGRLLHAIPAATKVNAHMAADRVFYEEKFDVSAVERSLRRLRVAGYKDMRMLHFLIAAYVRVVSMLPSVNRFVTGRETFAADDISVVLRLRRSENLEGSETRVKIHFQPTDTIFDVYRRIDERLEDLRASDEGNPIDELMDTLGGMPRFVLRTALWFGRLLDYFGWLPEGVVEASPYHASLIVHDAGSLDMAPSFRERSSIGYVPVELSFGTRHHEYSLDRHGMMVDRKLVDCRFTMDGRVLDERAQSKLMTGLRYIFRHPEIVESQPSRISEDVE